MIELYEKGARAAFENAKDLLDDAEILLTKKRFARSFALSILASEEFAKSMIYKFRSLGLVSEDERQDFDRAILDHKPKLKVFRKYLALTSIISQNPERVRRAVVDEKKSIIELVESLQKEMFQDEVWKIFERANEMKQRGFYVEVSGNKILSPKHTVKEEDARKTLGILRQKAIPRFLFFLEQTEADLNRMSLLREKSRLSQPTFFLIDAAFTKDRFSGRRL